MGQPSVSKVADSARRGAYDVGYLRGIKLRQFVIHDFDFRILPFRNWKVEKKDGRAQPGNANRDEIEAAGGNLGALAAAVDRKNWDGLPELAQAAAATEWRDLLNYAIMIGVNDGE